MSTNEADDAIIEEEWNDLRAAVRIHHASAVAAKKLAQPLRAVCVCGYSTTPGTPACEVLRKILAAQAQP